MGSRRTNGEGTVWRLKNGTWRGQLMDGFNDDGKKRIVNFSGETKAEVLDKVRDYKNNADANVRIDKSLTLNDWGETWYADYASQVQAVAGFYREAVLMVCCVQQTVFRP